MKIITASNHPWKSKMKKTKTRGSGVKILTLNKMLTRLPVLLAQVQVANNSYKVKNEIRQILYLLYQHNSQNILQQLNQIIIMMELIIINKKLHIIMLPWNVNFYLSGEFRLTSDIYNRIKFIAKKWENFATFAIKDEITHMVHQYRHGDDIQEHRKQRNLCTT